MSKVSVRGELGKSVSIVFEDTKPQTAESQDDISWLASTIIVEANGFKGSTNASLTSCEIASLRDEFEKLSSGSIRELSFCSVEEILTLRVNVDRAGRAVVKCTLHSDMDRDTSLSVEFESDLPMISQTFLELKKITRKLQSE